MEAEKLLDNKRESSCAIYMHYFLVCFYLFYFYSIFVSVLFLLSLRLRFCFVTLISFSIFFLPLLSLTLPNY